VILARSPSGPRSTRRFRSGGPERFSSLFTVPKIERRLTAKTKAARPPQLKPFHCVLQSSFEYFEREFGNSSKPLSDHIKHIRFWSDFV
jgi:hypothetical protein